jgi:ankyrin repeat protein
MIRNDYSCIIRTTSDFWQPPSYASIPKTTEGVKYFLKYHGISDINARNSKGRTILSLLFQPGMNTHDFQGLNQVIRALLDAGAMIDLAGFQDRTPLSWATEARYTHIFRNNECQLLKYLIEAGADFNRVDKEGLTPFGRAIRAYSKASVEYIMICVEPTKERDDLASNVQRLIRLNPTRPWINSYLFETPRELTNNILLRILSGEQSLASFNTPFGKHEMQLCLGFLLFVAAKIECASISKALCECLLNKENLAFLTPYTAMMALFHLPFLPDSERVENLLGNPLIQGTINQNSELLDSFYSTSYFRELREGMNGRRPFSFMAGYEGYTALHVAISRGRTRIVEALLKHGANPLLSCTYMGHDSTVTYVGQDKTCTDIAERYEDSEIDKLLRIAIAEKKEAIVERAKMIEEKTKMIAEKAKQEATKNRFLTMFRKAIKKGSN